MKNHVLTQIKGSESGKFKNAVRFIDEKTMLIYCMNRKLEIFDVIIDIEDLPRIVERYSSIFVNDNGYAYGKVRKANRKERLHRFIIGWTKEGYVCHHRNGISLDNRKSNLVEISFADNLRATRKTNAKSGFRNVYSLLNGKFQVRVTMNGKTKNFGTYLTAEEANEIAIVKRKELYGDLEGGDVVCY
ncbi:HNH endonuclease [Priestia megaterium]|uniref:HNH endonuclease n=1 Tax=Priestia megaterium TaxID=1404 RepID=UPI001FB55505|nr:HNH endonuclease [Priestia megaterium]